MPLDTLHHYILVKTCAAVFLVVAVALVYWREKNDRVRAWFPALFLFLMGAASALGYFFLVQGTETMLWGLKGDEITIAAMYERFAHGSFFSDFAYGHLPPFYPPLFFWIIAVFGRVFSWNGIQMSKWAATGVMLLYPTAFYYAQKLCWNRKSNPYSPTELSWFLSSILLSVVIDWDAIILKPYELISASLIILWTQFLMVRLWGKEKISKKDILMFGITGGILFLLFYFWFFLAAIGIALFHLFYKKVFGRKYATLALVGAITLFIGMTYIVPLARSYHAFGTENWQLGFLTPEWLATEAPFFTPNIQGLVLLIGLVSLIAYRERLHIRILLSLFVSSYVWQLMGYATIYFFSSPLQESKGFYFWNRSILALAAAYGIGELLKQYGTKFFVYKKTIAICSVVLLTTLLLPGTFVDQPKVYGVRERSMRLQPDMRELITFLEKTYPDIKNKTVLQSGLPELHAYLPFNDFVYFNMHNSHPAAQFSNRLSFLNSVAQEKDPKVFFEKIKKNLYAPIDLFIFYTGDPAAYPLYFHVDNFPYGFKEVIVNIPRRLFDSRYFTTIFENKSYIVFAPKTM